MLTCVITPEIARFQDKLKFKGVIFGADLPVRLIETLILFCNIDIIYSFFIIRVASVCCTSHGVAHVGIYCTVPPRTIWLVLAYHSRGGARCHCLFPLFYLVFSISFLDVRFMRLCVHACLYADALFVL